MVRSVRRPAGSGGHWGFSTGPPAPLDEGHRPADWLVEQALESVIGQVQVPENVAAPLRDALRIAAGTGSPEQIEKAAAERLRGADWRWPEFEYWRRHFAVQGRWPSAWQPYGALTAAGTRPPRTVAEAADYFDYLEMRDLLNGGIGAPGTLPLEAGELKKVFCDRISWERIAAEAEEKYTRFLQRCQASYREDLARLLGRHLATTIYNLIPYYQYRVVAENALLSYRLVVECDETCPVASHRASRFRRKEGEDPPPFYPGDASRLRLVPEDREPPLRS